MVEVVAVDPHVAVRHHPTEHHPNSLACGIFRQCEIFAISCNARGPRSAGVSDGGLFIEGSLDAPVVGNVDFPPVMERAAPGCRKHGGNRSEDRNRRQFNPRFGEKSAYFSYIELFRRR